MKQLYSLAFLILVLNFNAQIKYEFGPENEPAKDLRFNEVLGGTESHFYLHKINTEGKGINHFIQKMDRKTLLTVDAKEMVLEEKGYSFEVDRVVCYDDELTAFVTKRFKKTDDYKLVAITYDLNTMTKIKETQLEAFNTKPYNFVKLSLDNSKALIKLHGNSTEIIIYDLAKASVIWDGKAQEKFKTIVPKFREMLVLDGVLDNEGNIHLVSSLKNQSSSTKDFFTYHFYYTYINIKSNECKDYLIQTDYLFDFFDPVITCLPDKKVIISSMFKEESPDKKDGLKTGIVNCTIDNNTSIILSKKFSEIKQFNPKGNSDNNPKNLRYAYDIDESFLYGKTAILIGHKRVLPEFVYANDAGIAYGNIFVLKVNQNSEIELYKELPYSARTIGWNASHLNKQFVAEINENNLFVFHNEAEGTTKIIENNDKQSELILLWTGGKQFVFNKVNLIDGTNKRALIELPDKSKFNPIPESNYTLLLQARPPGSKIYNQFNNTLYIPLLWGYSMERFLKVTLD